MPANPIQRKTRNSFLLGMFIMLMIAIIIIAVLYLTLFKSAVDDATVKESQGKLKVYRTIQTIRSGDKFELGINIEETEMYTVDLPSDVITDPAIVNYHSYLDLAEGTILSISLIYEQESEIKDTTRLMEYNMITLPSTLSIGDFIDIRLMAKWRKLYSFI